MYDTVSKGPLFLQKHCPAKFSGYEPEDHAFLKNLKVEYVMQSLILTPGHQQQRKKTI